MEALNLLCSIVSTTLTSLALSLLLLFRTLLPRKISSRAVPSTSSATSTEAVTLYEGTVWHERRRPVHHSFRYSVRYALFDLDRSPHSPPDHLSADQARQIAATTGPMCRTLPLFRTFLIFGVLISIIYKKSSTCFLSFWYSLLLTIPPSVGYEQNPLSLYYCYDVEGSTQCLKKCIAEVGVCLIIMKLHGLTGNHH